ncbi:hypothetical protein B0J11DRAFT_597934 [Dendryphion nanum]|uniref:Uncharacterized protein n=1 Tax=Dendryphion nanum TaxID=256645 RepID=A0A9P9I9A0_9PLEO|nr:hypothetical protein B0J11DRAFT_597934 [Dendryphion nanum]
MSFIKPTNYDVYTGFWVNTRHGQMHGSTLTLDRQDGALFIAFLALYVGLAGQGTWRIVRFLLHRAYSSTKTPDGIYNQRQAILRNSESGYSAALEMIQLCFVWRKREAWKIWIRMLPLMGLSLLLSLAFAVAGILSSRVTSNDINEVLLLSQKCRDFHMDNYSVIPTRVLPVTSSQAAVNSANRFMKKSEYLAYALQCYRIEKGQSSANCQKYVQPRLPYTKDKKATCPFAEDLCILRSGNLELDTGYLFSDTHLGINGSPRFSLRQTRYCAPLTTEGYSITVTENGLNVTEYYYSQLSEHLVNQKKYNGLGLTYSVISDNSTFYKVDEDPTVFENLLPGRNHSGAMVSMLFLSSGIIQNSSPVVDPWFSTSNTTDSSPPGDQYVSNSPANVISCVTRVHICNPSYADGSKCLKSFNLLQREDDSAHFLKMLSGLWPNIDEGLSVYGALGFLKYPYEIFNPDIFYLGDNLPTILSSFTVLGRRQYDTIPPDRWQDELEYSFQASLASLQSLVVETAMGISEWINYVKGPCQSREACLTMCNRQIINSPLHQSFSVLGISLIIALGGMLIITGFWIEWIAAGLSRISVRRRNSHKPASRISVYARLEWHAMSVLQLQRLAHEALGFGTWTRANHMVPITESGDILGILDIEDGKHPTLAHPSTTRTMELVEVSTSKKEKENSFTTTEDSIDFPRLPKTKSGQESFLSRVRMENGRFDKEVSSASEGWERFERT